MIKHKNTTRFLGYKLKVCQQEDTRDCSVLEVRRKLNILEDNWKTIITHLKESIDKVNLNEDVLVPTRIIIFRKGRFKWRGELYFDHGDILKELKKPLFINITTDNKIEWDNDLTS